MQVSLRKTEEKRFYGSMKCGLISAQISDDIEFFIFHELRHMHQSMSVFRMENKEETQESYEEIKIWQYEFAHYIRNVDAKSEERNVRQKIEMDANAYALSLLNLYHMNDDAGLYPSIPLQTAEEVCKLSADYYDSKPELKRFCDAEKRCRTEANKQTTYVRNTPKVGANDLCPCGSGRKFKKCCRNKGIYDCSQIEYHIGFIQEIFSEEID